MLKLALYTCSILLISTLSQCPTQQTIYNEGKAECTFNFNNQNFVSCQIMESNSGVINNWGQCFSQCCQHQQVPSQQSCSSLNNCQQNSQQNLASSSKSLKIGLAIGLPIGFIILIAFCLFPSCPLRKLISKLFQKNISQQNKNEVLQKQLQYAKENTAGIKINLIENEIMDMNSTIKKTDVCPICLQSNPNVMLACSHLYHKKCGIESVVKKGECSLCRSTQIMPFRVYCNNCQSRYKVVSSLQGNDNDLCVNCTTYERYTTKKNINVLQEPSRQL